MEMIDDEFWKPLGKKWWDDHADTIGATNQQKIFACARLNGKSQTESARVAGYSDTGDKDTTAIRQIAYRTNRTNAVQNLIELATAANGNPEDRRLDPGERRRIYERLARKSDPSVKISALRELASMDKDEERRREEIGSNDPVATLKEIAHVNPVLALHLAKQNNLMAYWTPTAEQVEEVKRMNQRFASEYLESLKTANGHSTNDAEAKQQAAANSIDGSAKPIAEKQNGALVGAEA